MYYVFTIPLFGGARIVKYVKNGWAQCGRRVVRCMVGSFVGFGGVENTFFLKKNPTTVVRQDRVPFLIFFYLRFGFKPSFRLGRFPDRARTTDMTCPCCGSTASASRPYHMYSSAASPIRHCTVLFTKLVYISRFVKYREKASAQVYA